MARIHIWAGWMKSNGDEVMEVWHFDVWSRKMVVTR